MKYSEPVWVCAYPRIATVHTYIYDGMRNGRLHLKKEIIEYEKRRW